MKILILEPNNYAKQALDIYRRLGSVTLKRTCELFEDREVDALVIRLGFYVGQELLDNFPQVKYVISPTTGHTHIDENELNRRGVSLISLKGARSFLDTIPSTAEFTWLKIMSSIRYDFQYVEQTRTGLWDRYSFMARNLRNVVIGVVGRGRVATQLSRYAMAFNTKLIFHDIDPLRNEVSLDALFELADVVVLTASYEPDRFDYPIVKEKHLQLMKKNSSVINTARGELVDEVAILKKIKKSPDFYYYTDVLTAENDLKTSVLLENSGMLPNLVITPHIAGATVDSMHSTEIYCAEKFFELCEIGEL